eukprot:CAMPEP_0178409244 /NCGR_PEP_ID=MMETSP0689_2-20121128/20363_1 /TAXON_ID=160604 /ORGANISM="Amphidinium massartii, Strain CS-259" /LENGTH=519 /DNA_ID=CAMNT_0020030381 /DNA_START=52 /DNA_END=1608 /DNA_ORIENTATION=-
MARRICQKLCLFTAEDAEEFRTWWSIVWPLWAQIGFIASMDFTDAAVLGHWRGGGYLPEASSAVLVISLTMSLIQRGPSGAMTTLSSNAFAAEQTELAGRRLQAGSLLVVLICILVSPCWFWAGDILYGLAPSKEERPAIVDTFGRLRLFGMFASGQASVLGAWLAGRRQTRPAMLASMSAAILNLVLNFVLIYGIHGVLPGLGYSGSPIATAISRWTYFLGLLWWSFPEVRKCWPSGMRQSFNFSRMSDFLKLLVPLTLSSTLEDFNMEVTAVFALKFGRQELATHNSMLTAFFMLSTAMIGATNGLSARVSHHMVAGDLVGFRRIVRIASRLMILWSCVVMVSFVSLQDHIGKLFSSDEEVWQLSGQLAFLVGGAYFFMSFFYVSMAILQGIAKPAVVVLGFVIGCYGVGLPVAYLFGFHVDPHKMSWWPYLDPSTASGEQPNGCGILGLWFGLAAGYLVTTIVAVSRLLCIKDWRAEVAKARELAELAPQADDGGSSLATGLIQETQTSEAETSAS